MHKPEFLTNLERKPGSEWTEREVSGMIHWWRERPQERLVWVAAARYLGTGATREDIEEAWGTFYAQLLSSCCRSFRPGGPDFVTFCLHVCFRNYCVKEGEKIRRQNRACLSLSTGGEDGHTEEREIASLTDDPYLLTEQRALLEDVRNFLRRSDLPPQQKRAFELKHFEQQSNEEIARALDAEIGTVKVWAHRAAVKVVKYLKERGWHN